jgi:ribosomal small subunit protein bTHX
MGKGDKRTRRGKIFKGSFGKKRPKDVKSNSKKSGADQGGS